MRTLLLLFLCPLFVSAQMDPAFVVRSNLNYTRIEAVGDGLFGFEKDDKYGYMDKNEKVVIPAIYSFENTSYKTIPSFMKGYAKVKKDGKYGIIDKTGKIIIPFDYETLSQVYYLPNYAIVSRKVGSQTLYGLVTANKTVIPLEYQGIEADSNLVRVKQDGKWGLLDITGKKILPAEYSALAAYPKEKVLRAEKDGKYGFIDLTGKWLFEKSKSVFTLYGCSQGMVLCTISDKYGYLDLQGNEVIITKYDYAYTFENNSLAKVGKKISPSSYTYTYGYIDKKGNEVIPMKYEKIDFFSNGLVAVKDPETNRFGYMDMTGKWIIKAIYLDGLGFDATGGAWVKMTDGKYHYINKTGKDLGIFEGSTFKNFNKDGYAVLEYGDYPYALIDKTGKTIRKIDDADGIYNFSEGIGGYKCKSSAKYGFIDVNGKILTPCNFSGFSAFADGVSRVETLVSGKTKYGFINAKGETILPLEYDDLRSLRDGWGVIKKDGNYFFVDKNGNQKEPPRKYDNIIEFRSGYAIGVINGLNNNPSVYYYINTSLKEEFSIEAIRAYQFWEDVAVVNSKNVYELMNKKGEIFKTLTGIENIKFSSDGMLAVREKGKWGFIDDKGNSIIPAKYDSCDSFKYGYGRFKVGDNWGIVDKSGNEIIEAKYTNIIPGENGVFAFFDKFWGVMDKTGKVLVSPRFYNITAFEKDKALARLGKSYTIVKSPLVK